VGGAAGRGQEFCGIVGGDLLLGDVVGEIAGGVEPSQDKQQDAWKA
jgi:hypothetical protein